MAKEAGPDLSLVPIERLLTEIDRRYDNWVFCGMQCDTRISKTVTVRKWRGNSATCAGLASQLQIAIYDVYMESETPGYPP